MRPAEKGHVDYTTGVSDFKKVVVGAVTLNGLPLSVFEASGFKKILQQLFVLYLQYLQMWLNKSFESLETEC